MKKIIQVTISEMFIIVTCVFFLTSCFESCVKLHKNKPVSVEYRTIVEYHTNMVPVLNMAEVELAYTKGYLMGMRLSLDIRAGVLANSDDAISRSEKERKAYMLEVANRNKP